MRSMAPDLILIDLGDQNLAHRDSHRRLMAMADERNIAILDLSANQAVAQDQAADHADAPAGGAELIDIPRLLSEIERRIALSG
jgi:hypothetical protein